MFMRLNKDRSKIKTGTALHQIKPYGVHPPSRPTPSEPPAQPSRFSLFFVACLPRAFHSAMFSFSTVIPTIGHSLLSTMKIY